MTPRLLACSMVASVLLSAGAPGGTDPAGRHANPDERGQEIEVRLERFKFVPDQIEVTQGDRVRIQAWSADVKHGFGIRALGVDEDVPRGSDPVTIEFVASEPGAFEIACTEYCGIGHRRMKGLLLVRPQTSGGN